MICQAHLVEVQRAYRELRDAGATVLAITQSRSETLAAFVGSHEWPFPIVADPARHAYRAFGLERTSLLGFLWPGVVLRYLWLVLTGWLPRPAKAGEDVFQLGGDFIIDRDLRVRYAHPSATAADRPSATRLLDEVRKVRPPAH